jgi:hypothetical protein
MSYFPRRKEDDIRIRERKRKRVTGTNKITRERNYELKTAAKEKMEKKRRRKVDREGAKNKTKI